MNIALFTRRSHHGDSSRGGDQALCEFGLSCDVTCERIDAIKQVRIRYKIQEGRSVDGWKEGRMDGWMDGWMDGEMDR